MKTQALAVTLVAFASSACAHTIFQQVYVNGKAQGQLVGLRAPDYDGVRIPSFLHWFFSDSNVIQPVTDVTSNDIICNGGVNPITHTSNTIISVAAGSQISGEWHHTLAGAVPSDPADPVDPSHKGPVIAYLAKVTNATQPTVTGLKWFKIFQDGLDSSGKWGVDRMIANKGKVTFTIPSCIAPGQYLLRHELIALHGAASYPGAQFYMECAQLQITGGGTKTPATVSFPGAYHGTDPGITFNLYYPVPTSYTVPGPAVFTC
ncbi:glycoside hydrolase family 61 protein [Rickenella mellea]|uniref:AA9 family lytic polysaccharide monooxygenase n=1 Tax=Rickenella mellea TaxID=50990 RepID=A0A4Y7PL81_9AGAM|nr:glycoside hydrolase family 61 protein [Rickenella mellea]